jgi:hypothetical protein
MPPNVSDYDYSGYPPDLRWLLESFTDQILTLVEELEKAGKTLEEWLTEIAGLVTRFHSAAYMAGQKSGVLTQTDRDNISPYIHAQLDYLSGFGLVIQSEGEFQQGWYRRAASYARGIIAPYWKGAVKMLPLPAMPGDLTSQCGQLCACAWDVRVLSEELGDYDCYWVMNATREVKTEHCQTCLERARLWKPLQIRDMVLIIPESMIGGEIPEYQYKEFEAIQGELEALLGHKLKHLAGKHDQLSHGYRYGSFGAAKRTMRRLSKTRPYGNYHPFEASSADFKRRARARSGGSEYAREKRIREIEREIHKEPYEILYLLNSKGETEYRDHGDNKTIKITGAAMETIYKYTNSHFENDGEYSEANELTLIHNHPANPELRRDVLLKDPLVGEYYRNFQPQLLTTHSSHGLTRPLESIIPEGFTENDPFTAGSTFSQQDITTALAARFKEIRAVTPWGRTYIMRFNPRESRIDITKLGDNLKFQNDLSASHFTANKNLSNAIKLGIINPREYSANFWHEVWLQFTNDHPEYHMEYTWEIDPARMIEHEAAREVIY